MRKRNIHTNIQPLAYYQPRQRNEIPLVLSTISSLRTTILRQSQTSRTRSQNIMQAETKVTRPPEAVRIRASSTVFWNASNARKRLLPIDWKRGGLETR